MDFIPEIASDASTNTHRIRFKYGQKFLNQSTNNTWTGQFNQPQSYITFKATYKCGAGTGGDPAWYKLHLEGVRASCTPSSIFGTKCLTFNLTPTGCASGCSSGFSRGIARVQRHPDDYGYVATNPDSRGLPTYPLTKVNADTSGINPSAFHTNDRIWVS